MVELSLSAENHNAINLGARAAPRILEVKMDVSLLIAQFNGSVFTQKNKFTVGICSLYSRVRLTPAR